MAPELQITPGMLHRGFCPSPTARSLHVISFLLCLQRGVLPAAPVCEGEGAVRCSMERAERAVSRGHASHTERRVQTQLPLACFNLGPHLYDSK